MKLKRSLSLAAFSSVVVSTCLFTTAQAADAAAPAPAAVATQPVAAEVFDAMLRRWQAKLAGPATLDRSMPEIVAQLRAQADVAQRAQAGMHRDPGAKFLWDDLAEFDSKSRLTASGTVTSNAGRLAAMAQAYGTQGSPLYHDAALGADIVYGLDWFLREHYHPGRTQYGNWWAWQIGTPQRLLNALALAHEAIPVALRRRCLEAINWYVPDARYKTNPDGTFDRSHLEVSANLLDKAQVMILSGMLGHDGQRIAAGRDAIGPALQYVTKGNGFYRDGSYVFHGYIPYAGNYGLVALSVYGRLLYLLNDSPWRITDPNVANVFTWAQRSFADLLVDGAMPDALSGRKVSESPRSDHTVGRGTVAALAALSDLAPPSEKAQLRALVKGAMLRDRTFGNNYVTDPSGGTHSVGLHEMALLKEIAADPAIPAAPEAAGAKLYPSMDRAILRGAGFAAVLSMSSPRIWAYTSGNGENLKGWWQGMGMLYLYDAHQQQFDQNFWPTIDPRRLPGTTTDGSGSAIQEWAKIPNTESWVGGTTLGRYAAIGMAFSLEKVTGSSLHGRKSWFQLGDRILALGAGIAGGQGPVETIVENRRLADPSGAKLLVDGAPLANGKAQEAHWAHLRDDKAGSSIGYVFPAGTALQLERSERRGSWRDIHASDSAEVYRNTFQVLSIPHGKPQYAYLLMPNASEAATQEAAAKPDFQIEANDEQAAAVSLPGQGIYAANLWRAGSAPRSGKSYVSASAPVALLLARDGKRLQVAVADPTQRAASVEVGLQQPVAAVLKLPPGVTVLQQAPELRLRIDTTAAAGATFTAEFALK